MPSTTAKPLTTSITTTEADQMASLHLIADSIAQQRQLAARSMLTHPAMLSCLTFSLVITYFFTRALSTTSSSGEGDDTWPYLLLITWPACIMVYLLAAAHTTHPYLEKAGRTGTWVWLWRGGTRYKHRWREQSPSPSRSLSSTSKVGDNTRVQKDHHNAEKHEEDEKEGGDIMLVTKYHDRVIGTLVLRIIHTEEELWGHVRDAAVRDQLYQYQQQYTPSTPGTGSCQPVVGVIRAWTVQQHLRGIGVGRNLLENAIRICRERGVKGPVFSDCHANEVLGLPVVCNGEVVRRERWAREVLERVKWEVYDAV
ncbi:inorganic phosphate transporter pho84 [Aspergillus tubingensis]|nr:inorganic phosphate transporter pho84 [Aspergillus tubingensis]